MLKTAAIGALLSLSLVAAGCGDDHAGTTCADLAAAAVALCDTLDEAMCQSQCEDMNHPHSHLDMAHDCMEEATDCAMANDCLVADDICDSTM